MAKLSWEEKNKLHSKEIKNTCPDCGYKLVPAGGCSFCPNCGFSPCK